MCVDAWWREKLNIKFYHVNPHHNTTTPRQTHTAASNESILSYIAYTDTLIVSRQAFSRITISLFSESFSARVLGIFFGLGGPTSSS